MNPTPTQPPQGVMAELRELLAAAIPHGTGGDDGWAEHLYRTGRHVPLVIGALRALPGLLDEVEALRAENERVLRISKENFDKLVQWIAACEQAEARASALLARCEGLEAALREVLPYFEGEHHPDHPHVLRIREALAATRTTGDGT